MRSAILVSVPLLLLGFTGCSTISNRADFSHSRAPAQDGSACEEGVESYGNLQIQTLETQQVGCELFVSPVNAAPAYRNYSIGQWGSIQVFNGYPVANGTNGNSTGSRSYFLFPRRQVPTACEVPAADADGNSKQVVDIITASGDVITFDPSQPRIDDHPNNPVFLSEDPEVSPDNGGGVQLKLSASSRSLLLDSGFQMGQPGFMDRAGSSVFADSKGDHCSVPNSSLFAYTRWDATFRYATDEALFSHLKQVCPKLELPELSEPAPLPNPCASPGSD